MNFWHFFIIYSFKPSKRIKSEYWHDNLSIFATRWNHDNLIIVCSYINTPQVIIGTSYVFLRGGRLDPKGEGGLGVFHKGNKNLILHIVTLYGEILTKSIQIKSKYYRKKLSESLHFLIWYFCRGYSSVAEHSTADREVSGSTPDVPWNFSFRIEFLTLFHNIFIQTIKAN